MGKKKRKEKKGRKKKEKMLMKDMVDKYLSPKFGINSFHSFSENGFYSQTTDGRTTDDGLQRESSSSAVQ